MQVAAVPPPVATANKPKGLHRYSSVEQEHTDNELIEAHTREEYVSLFRTRVKETAKATLDLCRLVYEAWKTLDEANYEAFCQEVGYKDTSSTIRKVLAIGKVQPRIAKYADQLPASWTSIYQLTQIPASVFERMLNEGKSLSSLSGSEIKELVACTREISSITSEVPREAITRHPMVAKVFFTKRDVDDGDWYLMRKAFAALEARLPIKFSINEIAEEIAEQRKLLRYEIEKKKSVKLGINIEAWDLDDVTKTKLEPVEEVAA